MKNLIKSVLAGLIIGAPASATDYQRIVSAGGDITEIIFALGAGDKVVGVDSTSGYPALVNDLSSIGYVRGLAAEGILSLSPDLLIGSDDMGPPNVIENLKAAGLSVARAPSEAGSMDRVSPKIAFVGETLGLQDKAADMIAKYKAKMDILAKRRDEMTDNPRVLFVLSVRDGAPIVGGKNSSADAIIELAGGVNVASGFEGWKPMNSEAIISSQPDLILMTSAHADRIGGQETLMKRPDISLTPAGKAGRIATMDAILLLGFGPRTPQAVEALMDILQEGNG